MQASSLASPGPGALPRAGNDTATVTAAPPTDGSLRRIVAGQWHRSGAKEKPGVHTPGCLCSPLDPQIQAQVW